MNEFLVPKNKLATNPKAQFAWLAAEMDYSRTKADYIEKLLRLAYGQHDPKSVFGFMSSNWDKITKNGEYLNQISKKDEAQAIVTKILQAVPKLVAGMCDKVALTIWLEAKAKKTPLDYPQIINDSLLLVRGSVPRKVHPEEDLSLLTTPFGQTPMGLAVVNLHQEVTNGFSDIAVLRAVAVQGAVGGLLFFRAYAGDLAKDSREFDLTMPKPGITSGQIVPWE